MSTTLSNVIYHPAIDEYMHLVESGLIESCQEQKDLMKWLRVKLEDAVIDSDIIDKAISVVDNHFEGKLIHWQKFIFAFVFGVREKTGNLMFNEFLIMLGRGGGKTGFMARLEFALSIHGGSMRYNVDIVATSEDQARESFDEVWEMFDDDRLNNGGKRYGKHFYFTKEKYMFKKTRSVVRYRTNNAKTKDGGRQGCVVFDEIHAYKDESSIKVFVSGLGKKPNARRFYFTTDGYNRDGFLDMLKDESKMILAGDRPNRKTFPFICKLDDAEEVHDEAKWRKANPSLDFFPHLLTEMQDEYEKLKDRSGSKVEFMTKRMNMPTIESNETVTTWENIKATNQEIPDLKGQPCVGGIDYADTTDFCVVGLLFLVNKKYYWLSHTFICHLALEGRNYKVPIDLAVEQGRVTIVRDDMISPEIIFGWFAEQSKKYHIVDIASDLFRINYLRDEFTSNGFKQLLIARSGTKTHSELEPFVNEIFANRRMVWGDDLMMRWYTWNTYKKRDQKGNMSYEKIEPKLRKTDGFFALLHALQYRDKLNVPKVRIRRKLRTYSG